MSRSYFAVVGDPVRHSASPRMHAAAYRLLGLDCVYDAIHATAEELPSVIARLRSGELSGLNVTLPHKERVLALVDAVDESARAANAANTLVRNAAGQLVAYNTDVTALADELRDLAGKASVAAWSERHVLILGTGATARSAVLALGRDLGVARITVRGRALIDDERRAALRAELRGRLALAGCSAELACEPWFPSETTERSVGAIVQATSLGMTGWGAGEVTRDVVAWKVVSKSCVALDVVYGASRTAFVVAAKAHGLRTADGRGMLARQGARAFSLWFGRGEVLAVMRAALDD